MEQLDGQMSLLLNEAEVYSTPLWISDGSPYLKEIQQREGGRSGHYPVEVEELRLSEEERVCPQYEKLMHKIGAEVHINGIRKPIRRRKATTDT